MLRQAPDALRAQTLRAPRRLQTDARGLRRPRAVRQRPAAHRAAAASPSRRRRRATSSSATATASSTAPRSAGSTTRRRCSSTTRATCSARGSRIRSRWRRSARSIARRCALNEDLVEAIALAHDLGHTPFGHAGQDALHECMRPTTAASSTTCRACASSTCSRSAIRLRRPEPQLRDARGHPQALLAANARAARATSRRRRRSASLPARSPSLEAQLANLADEIAYNAHDIDDGVRSGLLTLEQLDDGAAVRAHRGRRCAHHSRHSAAAGVLLETCAACCRHAGRTIFIDRATRRDRSCRAARRCRRRARLPRWSASARDARRGARAEAASCSRAVPPSAGACA